VGFQPTFYLAQIPLEIPSPVGGIWARFQAVRNRAFGHVSGPHFLEILNGWPSFWDISGGNWQRWQSSWMKFERRRSG
jgi:hypothetical protein